MKYALIAYYRTGNSFGHEDTSTVLHEFDNLEVAKAAMKRLEEHYKWYQWNDKGEYDQQRALGWGEKPVEEPEWHKELEYDFQASYYLENDVLFTDCMPYCGYFERLHSLEIIPTESDMKIEF